MTIEIIDFIGMTGQIEETSGRRKFKIIMETEIREYEKKMLCSGECRYMLPMHFISENGMVKSFYDFTGYIQLKEYAERKLQVNTSLRETQKLSADALDILSGILECIKGMENYLIFPDRITIHPDVVFLDPNSGRVVLAFYPDRSAGLTLQGRIANLIRDLSSLFCFDETDQYLKRIEDFIDTKNPGLDGIIGFLGAMQREVSYIYWDTKNFRRIEEEETAHNQDQSPKRKKRYDFRLKTAVIQLILATGLIAVFLSGKLSTVNFAGLIILTGAVDLLILRKQKILDS